MYLKLLLVPLLAALTTALPSQLFITNSCSTPVNIYYITPAGPPIPAPAVPANNGAYILNLLRNPKLPQTILSATIAVVKGKDGRLLSLHNQIYIPLICLLRLSPVKPPADPHSLLQIYSKAVPNSQFHTMWTGSPYSTTC